MDWISSSSFLDFEFFSLLWVFGARLLIGVEHVRD
jgi:hypothetical protein